jgi:hypothetical protein
MEGNKSLDEGGTKILIEGNKHLYKKEQTF